MKVSHACTFVEDAAYILVKGYPLFYLQQKSKVIILIHRPRHLLREVLYAPNMMFSLPFYYKRPEDSVISEYLKDYHKLQSLAPAIDDASKINRLKFYMRGHAGDVAEAINKTGFVDILSVWPYFFKCFANKAKNEGQLTFPAYRSRHLLGEVSYAYVL